MATLRCAACNLAHGLSSSLRSLVPLAALLWAAGGTASARGRLGLPALPPEDLRVPKCDANGANLARAGVEQSSFQLSPFQIRGLPHTSVVHALSAFRPTAGFRPTHLACQAARQSAARCPD